MPDRIPTVTITPSSSRDHASLLLLPRGTPGLLQGGCLFPRVLIVFISSSVSGPLSRIQIICIVMYREGNRDLASLVSPLKRDKRRIHAAVSRPRSPSSPEGQDPPHPPGRYLSPVSWESPEAYSQPAGYCEPQDNQRVPAAGSIHAIPVRRLRFDLHQRKHSLQLGNSHIGNTNITDHALFHQGFTLTVGIHKLFHTERSGIRIS